MSDPLKHTDIDDLVSSIRRLVSDESRAEPVEQKHETPDIVARASEPEPESFVLSPTLRVSEAEDPYQAIHSLEEHIPESEAPPVQEAATATVAEAQKEQVEEQSSAEVLQFHDPEIDELSESEDLEASAIFRSINRRGTARMLEEARELAGQEHGEERTEPPKVAEREPAPAEPVEEVLEAPQPHAPTPPSTSEALEAEIVDLDELIPEEVETTEPPVTPVVESQEEVIGELVDAAEAPEPMVEGVLDEEQLREIVADVVREELAGHLGERITRNVRKLVRRELRQLMANTEYE